MTEKLDIKDFSNQDEEFNASEFAKTCNVDLSVSLTPPEVLLSIGQHEYKGKHYPTSVMTAGEFSVITATSKSKKSFLKSGLLASYIGGNANQLFNNIRTHRDANYTVLDFDTEQGEYYTQRSFRRVLEVSGGLYENYHGYATRHLTSKQRLLLIDYCINNQEKLYKEKIKLIAIDGVADLVENTNDIVMSKEASDYLLKWTHEHNIHITTIIHKSASTGKPLGHLGTFVLKKAETVMELDIQEDCTVKVSNPYSRGYRFEDFYFDVNSDALPYVIQNAF